MNKLKLLCWGDSPDVSTGFGVVTRYVMSALYKTGKYEIHQLAINHDGRFLDNNKYPWQLQPAKLLNPNDPYGNQMLLNAINKEDYDLVWIINDTYVTNGVAKELKTVCNNKTKAGKKAPLIVYYYPVDCQVIPEGSEMLRTADVLVTYTDHGTGETKKAMPALVSKLNQIPHGVNTNIFKPLSKEESLKFRKKLLGVGEEKYVIINVNRNTTRKQLQYTLLAFKEFRKHVPNSVLYMHAAYHDQGGDLLLATRDLGFDLKKDVVFPVNYGPGMGISEEALNGVYNAADMYISTHLGEGWGLSIGEALAAGTPVIVPNNTCMPQLIGENEERGYMYPCNDILWIDNSGYRKKGNIPDILQKMLQAHQAGSKYDNPKVALGREWALQHDWSRVTKQWVSLLEKVMTMPRPEQPPSAVVVSEV